MTTLKIDIENERDISAITEILEKFHVSYQIEHQNESSENALSVYKRLKSALKQIQLHQTGNIQLKTLKQGLADLKNEL